MQDETSKYGVFIIESMRLSDERRRKLDGRVLKGMLDLCDIKFDELEEIMGTYLTYRRLFLSACEAATFELAQHFIPKHHCHSIVGTPETIDLDKAAIFWSSFYYLM